MSVPYSPRTHRSLTATPPTPSQFLKKCEVITRTCDAKKLDRHRSDTGNTPTAPTDRARPPTLPPLQPWLGAIVPAVAVLTIQSPQTHPHRAIWCNFGAVPPMSAVASVETIAPCRSDCRQFWSLIGGKP